MSRNPGSIAKDSEFAVSSVPTHIAELAKKNLSKKESDRLNSEELQVVTFIRLLCSIVTLKQTYCITDVKKLP